MSNTDNDMFRNKSVLPVQVQPLNNDLMRHSAKSRVQPQPVAGNGIQDETTRRKFPDIPNYPMSNGSKFSN